MHDWRDNPGRKPRWPDDTPIEVVWRNGFQAPRTFTVGQLRWEPWPAGPHDYDILKVRRIAA